MNINEGESYLIGLILGKGTIYSDDSIAIEFPYHHEYVMGIAFCPMCNHICTQPLPTDNRRNGKFLRCKNENCHNSTVTTIDPEVKNKYHQPSLIYNSIRDEIIPFLHKYFSLKHDLVSWSASITLKVQLADDEMQKIKKILGNITNFSNSYIPELFNETSYKNKIELVNGLIDSAGKANAGNRYTNDRQRLYFQIINRNYKLPISLDNFLRTHFKIPIQTIRWGHPNITDGNLKDFLKGKSSAVSREHQVKIFIEYMDIFKLRIESSRKLLDEMFKSTAHLNFQKSTEFLPKVTPITFDKIRAHHPEEQNLKIDKLARDHFDAGWQISLRMGCIFLNEYARNATNHNLYLLTGQDDHCNNIDELINDYQTESQRKSAEIQNNFSSPVVKEPARLKRTNPEKETYIPLVNWLKKYTENNLNQDMIVFDSSNQTLDNFIYNSGDFDSQLTNEIEFDKFHIRPDIVACSADLKNFIFIESKVVPLGLKQLGQLIGYCMVANPQEAFLVSTKGLSRSLSRVLLINKSILNYYKNRRIQIGKLVDNKVEIMDL